ncbi:MAG: hypothetical protein IJ192_15475 [Clostridia bacterium]|nr:hypothetical protein [Clostridia bacterium]
MKKVVIKGIDISMLCSVLTMIVSAVMGIVEWGENSMWWMLFLCGLCSFCANQKRNQVSESEDKV